MIWEPQGTNLQKEIVRRAIEICDFPFERMRYGLRQDTGRDAIPVEWADLSRYATAATVKEAATRNTELAHLHRAHDSHDDAEYDVLAYRERVLGLAWYNGKVSLEITLDRQPELAMEVFLSEGAHMVDFFYLSDRQRIAIWNAHHEGGLDIAEDADVEESGVWDHEHGWFDASQYRDWIGESFMGAFVRAFAPEIPVTIPFSHALSSEGVKLIRDALLHDPEWYFGVDDSNVYHDQHRGIDHDVEWPVESPPSDRRPCGVCKP